MSNSNFLVSEIKYEDTKDFILNKHYAQRMPSITFSFGGVRIKYGERLYHDKTIRTYYKGKLKPYALRIKNALENGDAEYIESKGKHIYYYSLKRKRKPQVIWGDSTQWLYR